MGKYNYHQWEKYCDIVYLLLHGPLSDFEHEFLQSCWRYLGSLSDKQVAVLDKIIAKYYDHKRDAVRIPLTRRRR